MTSFADRLAEAVRKKGNPLCVGFDPRWESLPQEFTRNCSGTVEERADAYLRFFRVVLKIVAPLVPVIKPQSAFFETCGGAGIAVLKTLMDEAREAGLLVILDAKRGDIASTAEAYAASAFEYFRADALTVNPWLGADSIEPFLASCARNQTGVFILVRTSNPGGGLFQNLLCEGKPLYQHVAEEVRKWNHPTVGKCGLGDIGAVVGATHPQELKILRELLPEVWFLVPGYGAQGATAADLRGAFRADGLGAVVNSSRGITFAFKPENPNWREAIEAATRKAIADFPQG